MEMCIKHLYMERMSLENLKTDIGEYTTFLEANIPFAGPIYPDSLGYYYSASAIENCCPEGWHVPTITEWQNLHYEIYGTPMNPNGYTNSNTEGYEDNDYRFLWNVDEDGTNQSFFNLFLSGQYSEQNNDISNGNSSISFWTSENCGGSNLWKLNIYNGNGTGNGFWGFDVGCSGSSYIRTQI